jgi:hypothetical protein
MKSASLLRSISLPTAAGGVGTILLGIWLYSFFSPSPHGYLELFVALPVSCLGLACTGAAFLVDSPHHRVLRQTVGWGLILAAASPLFIAVAVVLMGGLRLA